MRYLDVCAGISASTVAWKPLGWQAAAYSEIEAAPRAILAHHYPDTPLHGDFTTIRGDEYGAIDLLVGGTPCQDFSIAGLRAGLGGDRGNLSLQFLLLLARTRARWVVWENVPGVFSSLSHDAPDARPPAIDLDGDDGPDDGEEVVVEDEYDADESHALGCFLAGLSELGYGLAYRVLDAQFAGVPQRRRRIFVVGHLGDWRRAAAVLLERHSLLGNTPPGREAGEGIARPIAAGSKRGSGYRNDADTADNLIAATVSSKWAKGSGGPSGDECQNLLAVPQLYSIMPMNSGRDYVARPVDVAQPLMAGGPVGGNQGGDFVVPFDTTQITSAANYSNPKAGDPCHPLAAGAHAPAVAFAIQEKAIDPNPANGPQSKGYQADLAYTLEARSRVQSVAASAVRRLTPRECERLQGFPDDYTLVPYRGRMMADGPRYKALGNSMAVPVMRWIGERIAMVDALQIKDIAA